MKDKQCFWHGIEYKFPLCCIMFFCDFWTVVRREKLMFNGRNADDWYDNKKNEGRVYCPDCFMKEMKLNV